MTIAEAAATIGATIRLRYTIHLDNGKAYPPMGPDDHALFELGKGQTLPGIEKAVEGMKPGEKKSVRIASGDAFGPRRPERRFQIARPEPGPAGSPLRVGDAVRIQSSLEGDCLALIEEIRPTSLLVDANHPLSGQDLTIDLDVLDVIPGSERALAVAWK